LSPLASAASAGWPETAVSLSALTAALAGSEGEVERAATAAAIGSITRGLDVIAIPRPLQYRHFILLDQGSHVVLISAY